jgi:hypothetical protein
MTYFKVLSQNLPGKAERRGVTQDSQSKGQESNPGPPEYEAGKLAIDIWSTIRTGCRKQSMHKLQSITSMIPRVKMCTFLCMSQVSNV